MGLLHQLADEQARQEHLQAQTAAAEVAAGSQMQDDDGAAMLQELLRERQELEAELAAREAEMQQQEIGVGVDSEEDSEYADDEEDDLDIAALIAQGGTPEQMQLLEMMQGMVAQKEALQAEELTRAESLREEMAKLEYLKQLQAQQTQQLEQQRFEEIPEAASAEEEEENSGSDGEEVDPGYALQILEGLKSQLNQLQEDPRELSPDEQARELALERELVELRGMLQQQVERLEAEQTEVQETTSNGAGGGSMEQSVYQDDDDDDSDEVDENLMPEEMRQLLASLQAQKTELEAELAAQLEIEKHEFEDGRHVQQESPSPQAASILAAELGNSPTPTEIEMMKLQAQLQEATGEQQAQSDEEAAARAELVDAMEQMQKLKEYQERLEQELAMNIPAQAEAPPVDPVYQRRLAQELMMNLPSEESDLIGQQLAARMQYSTNSEGGADAPVNTSVDMRTHGYAAQKQAADEEEEDDFDIEALIASGEHTPEQMQLLSMMKELMAEKDKLEQQAAAEMGEEVAAAAARTGDVSGIAAGVTENAEEAAMLQELLRERQALEAELAAKTRQQEEAEVMEQQVAALLQEKMAEEQALSAMLQQQMQLQEKEKQLLQYAQDGDEDPEPELEDGEVAESEEEQLAALQMLSALLKEKEALGRQLDQRLTKQKLDSANLSARMDALDAGEADEEAGIPAAGMLGGSGGLGPAYTRGGESFPRAVYQRKKNGTGSGGESHPRATCHMICLDGSL